MIEKIKQLNIEKLITITTFILIISFPALKLLSYCLYLSKIINNIYIINLSYMLYFLGFIYLLLYLYGIIKHKFKITYIDVLTYILAILAILSCIYAIDQDKALFGESYRYEGLYSIISYYLILLNLKNLKIEKYKKFLIKTFLVVGVVSVIYSVMQVYTDFSFIKHYSKHYMASGLFSNANFYGSFILMNFVIAFTYYLKENKLTYLLLSVIYFVGLCLANSTGPFLSAILVIIVIIAKLRNKIKIKKVITILSILTVTFFIIDKTNIMVTKYLTGEDLDSKYNISQELRSKNMGVDRLKIWKNSMPLVKKYWLVGAGLDNFKNVYPQSGWLAYDKAHNIYIQMAVTNGIPALLIYCIICLLAFIKIFKAKNLTQIVCLIAFIGYSIQAFANINVINVTPYFYVFLGIIFSYDSLSIKDQNKRISEFINRVGYKKKTFL